MEEELVFIIKITIKNNKKTSLALLKANAFIAAFNVPRRLVQKFIRKNEVRPINSQPKNSNIQLSDTTKRHIEITNQFKKSKKRSALGSFLKYVREYATAHTPMEVVRNKKEKLTKSTKIVKLNWVEDPNALKKSMCSTKIFDSKKITPKKNNCAKKNKNIAAVDNR